MGLGLPETVVSGERVTTVPQRERSDGELNFTKDPKGLCPWLAHRPGLPSSHVAPSSPRTSKEASALSFPHGRGWALGPGAGFQVGPPPQNKHTSPPA